MNYNVGVEIHSYTNDFIVAFYRPHVVFGLVFALINKVPL